MNPLEGANCADLPGFVIDKYFDCKAGTEPFRRDVALAICGRCAVQAACRDEALNGPVRDRGVVGGVTAAELRRGRTWRRYEQGITDTTPSVPRPEWLQRTDATETTEQLRLEADADEPVDYEFDLRQDGPAIVTHLSQIAPAPSRREAAKTKPARKRPLRLAHFNVDVPVPLPGANCADMPRELVDKYFNADVARESAAARLAMTVCDHCVILETCRQRALNGSSVRSSGVIAGMGARELERGRVWRRYEQGWRTKPPTGERPEWLELTPAGAAFDAQATSTQEEAGDSVVE